MAMTTAAPTGLTADVVDYLVATASRAPSVHNTQPWRFRFGDGTIELRADPERGLRVADYSGRELVISCGAALFTLELAIRGLGLEPRTVLLPDPGEPRLLARVHALPGGRLTHDESRLMGAVTRRHTHRGAFSDIPPSTDLLDHLRWAARHEGAWLSIVPEGPQADSIVELAWTADTEQRTDLAWRVEMNNWVNEPGSVLRDGVPVDSYPEELTAYNGRQLPVRDFSGRRRWGTGESAESGASVLAVLSTNSDRPRAWLHAGVALQRVLLTAADAWVFAAFATQPLEVPQIRGALREVLGTSDHPQMLFRLGHAPSAAVTPRRPVRAVLESTGE
jgi:hypothetical protein